MRRGSGEHDTAMLRAAQLYYEVGLTQDQIAKRMLLTRWKVGRLLDDAKEAGIVRIEILHPRARQHDLEDRLLHRYGLRGAVVLVGGEDETEQRVKVAGAAADFLCDLDPLPRTLGVSWGRTMVDVATALTPGWNDGVEVVQINGAVSRSRQPSTGVDVATTIARSSPGTLSVLSAPAIVERVQTSKALQSDPSIARVIDAGRTADALIFSLGALAEDSVLVEAGYLSAEDELRLREKGATGDVLGRFIDANGQEVERELSERTVGLGLDDIRNAKCAIAVSAGAAKADVTGAVVSNGLCDVVITDSLIAENLLGEDH